MALEDYVEIQLAEATASQTDNTKSKRTYKRAECRGRRTKRRPRRSTFRRMARTYETIILHCGATPPSMDIGAHVIDKWHRARGWAQCGYHYVIRRNGKIDRGRHISIRGAHAKGYIATV